MSLTRRRFLTLSGGTAVWLVAGCQSAQESLTSPSTLTPTTLTSTTLAPPTSGTVPGADAIPPSAADDRVLVVVQLLGGNDALNTIVPDSGVYRDARPGIALPEDSLLHPAGLAGYSFHPSLAPLSPHWEGGRLAIGAGVGFTEQTRSHFESRDVWWRATSDPTAAGWLARWIEAAAIDTPDEPLEAIALGVGPRALAGSTASAVNDPTNFVLKPPDGMADADFERFILEVSAGTMDEASLLQAARSALPATLSVQKILADLDDDSAGSAYVDRNEPELFVQLRTAAALISTRPALRVVTVGIEGFDTHADQLSRQANLLDQVSTALSGFWDLLPAKDQARTLVMTTSEFGRRVAENGSEGTDHGNSGVHFLFGPAAAAGGSHGVNGGQIVGGYDLGNLVDGDIPVALHSEELFADALRWLGGPVEEVLGIDPASTGLIVV